MRTLKKTLALVLVLAMMFSLCITASAYTDDAEIEYADAVELLSLLGVIEGYPDGSFGAEKTLNRAEAAAIIARLNGYFDLAAATPSYTDMAGYGWANSAVAYCESEGIVNGTGEGKFEPATTLTGYMFVKMLAVSMGVDAEEAGMTGAAWQIGVTKINKEFGITAGIEDMDLGAAITREEAAQCAFNALFASRDGYTWAVDHNGHTHYFKSEEDALLFAAAALGSSIGLPYTGEFECTLGYEVFGLIGEIDGQNEWGQPFRGWFSVEEGFLNAVPYAPVATFTTKFTEDEAFKATAGAFEVLEHATTEDYVEVEESWYNGVDDGYYWYDKGSIALEPYSGNGTYTYFYATEDLGNIVVFIEQYLGVVTNVYKADAETGADRIVVVDGICCGVDHDWELVSDSYEKGDVLLYNLCDGVPCNVKTPETVSGTVVKTVTTDETVYTIGDADYVMSAHNDCTIALGDTAVWYVDDCGNLMLKAANIGLNYKVGYLLGYDAQNVYGGDKMHGETYDAYEKYVIYDAEAGVIELAGEVVVADYDLDGDLETYLPGQAAWVETFDAFSADIYDIATGAGKYDTKVGALSTGLVLYLTNEAGEIYYISDTQSIDGALQIADAPNIDVLSTSVYINGGSKFATDDTAFFYTGLTKQDTVSAAIGYANAKKDVNMPGEVVYVAATNEVIATSQHADPGTAPNATGYLYVSDRFDYTSTTVATYDKYTDSYSYKTTYTYTGLYLDGKEIASYTVAAPLSITGENLYKVEIQPDGKVLVPGTAEAKIIAEVVDFDGVSYIMDANGVDYILDQVNGTAYFQLGNHAVAEVEALPALSAAYDVVLYYVDSETAATVVYFFVD